MPENKFRWDLTDINGEYVFEQPPTDCWVIFSLEFPTIYSQRKYIMVTQPNYGTDPSLNLGGGIWYPPFLSFQFPQRRTPLRKLGDLRKIAEEVEKEEYSCDLVESAVYNMGLGEPKFEKCDPNPYIDEYKKSPRNHDRYKFFRIVRIRCWHDVNEGKQDLADPESIKGQYYVPLDAPKISPDIDELGPHNVRYFSRVVGSHFDVLQKYYGEETAEQKYTKFSDGHLVNSEDGYILFLDVSGFGAMESRIQNDSFNPNMERRETAESFRVTMSRFFLAFCEKLNILQYVTLGDGLIAGVPKHTILCPDVFLCDLSDGLAELGKKLHEMNNRMLPSGEIVGLRTCIVKGEYRYGKIAGLSSLRAEFEGDILIYAARLDEATKETLTVEERKGLLVVASPLPEILDIKLVKDSDVCVIKKKIKETSVCSNMKTIKLKSI